MLNPAGLQNACLQNDIEKILRSSGEKKQGRNYIYNSQLSRGVLKAL